MNRIYVCWAHAIALSVFSAIPVIAQEVTLKSYDGSISITGDLLETRGDIYVIRSPIGQLEINALEMRCIGAACPIDEVATSGGTFEIAGSSSILRDVIPQLVEGYAFQLDADVQMNVSENTTSIVLGTDDVEQIVAVDIKMSNSLGGLNALRDKSAVLAVSTRPSHDNEQSYAKGEQILALDGIVVLAHPNNPVRAVAEQDLPTIFSGAITKWADLGGYDSDINIYIQEEDSGTFDVFSARVLTPAGVKIAPNVNFLESDQAVADAVANDPFGIGIGNFSALRNAKAMTIRGTCGVQTPATAFTIRTEEYPLTRRIYLYQSEDELVGHAASLVDFALSDEGQFIIAANGFIDQRVSSEPVNNQGIRLASAVMENGADTSFRDLRSMMRDLVVGERLSLTFRFEFGSSTLDSRAVGDIQRLAALLSTGDYQNKEVLLAGFTDSIGDARKNRVLSKARAAVVQQALIAAAPAGSLDNIQIRADGFGEVSPLGCNDADAGRAINRRVEVWMSDQVRKIN